MRILNGLMISILLSTWIVSIPTSLMANGELESCCCESAEETLSCCGDLSCLCNHPIQQKVDFLTQNRTELSAEIVVTQIWENSSFEVPVEIKSTISSSYFKAGRDYLLFTCRLNP